MSDKFLVKTEAFEGPLDLLLHLIEKRKLLINEVSLIKITDDYIEYIQSHDNISLKNNAHFILVASTLVLIKSKSLLPTLELTREEEQDIEDLEARIYQRLNPRCSKKPT
jgi:segregation and condensation protein A